jgi:hypothetical protein
MERKFYDGKLSIGRVQSNMEPDFIEISVTDTKSGCFVIRTKVDLQSFAEAITNLGYRPCTFEYYKNAPIGMKKEVKHAFVAGECPYYKDKEKQRTAKEKFIKPFEVDGWEAYYDDFGNHHHFKREEGVQGYMVSFHRFVEDKE